MSATAPAAHDIDLARGQSLNLWLATLASTVGFWAWTMIGPLSAHYTESMGLAPTQTAVLVAMPILVGAVARDRLQAIQRHQGHRVEPFERPGKASGGGGHREVGDVASLCLGFRAGGEGQVGLAGAVRAFQVQPTALAGGQRTQLVERSRRRAHEGLEALVRRIAQRKR